MATVGKGNYLKGVLGPLVFSNVNGQQRIKEKSAPGTMKQTEATKKASGTFGMASTFGAQLRSIYSGELKGFQDSLVNIRLAGILTSLLQACRDPKSGFFNFDMHSFSGLAGFEFNSHSKVSSRMLQLPEVSFEEEMLTVAVPSLAIGRQFKFPPKTSRCILIVSVSLFRLRDGKMLLHPENQQIELFKNGEFTAENTFKFNIPKGCLCTASLFLDYSIPGKNGWLMFNNKLFSPASILSTWFTAGNYEAGDHYKWVDMLKFE